VYLLSSGGQERYMRVSSEMDRAEICIICICWWVFLWLGDAPVMSRSSSEGGRLLVEERSFDLCNFLPNPFRWTLACIALARHCFYLHIICFSRQWADQCSCESNTRTCDIYSIVEVGHYKRHHRVWHYGGKLWWDSYGGTLRWHTKMELSVGTLRWDTTVDTTVGHYGGHYGETLRWDTTVRHYDGTLWWHTSVDS